MKRLPRVGFRLALAPDQWRRESLVREDLARLLARGLSTKFGRVSIEKWPLIRMLATEVCLMALVLNESRFGIFVKRAENSRESWCVGIDPLRYNFHSMGRVDETKYAKELEAISDEIHSILRGTPGIEGLRWFFEGWDINTPAMASPGQLPWCPKSE